MRTWHQPNEDRGADELLLQEYEHFLSGKAEGTIDAYVRTMRHVMEWLAQRPGNGGLFHPRQLTKTAVEVYLQGATPHIFLAHPEQEGGYARHSSGLCLNGWIGY